MKHIAFIINPISGAKRLQQVKRQLPELVNQILDHEQWQQTLVYTTHAGQATELAQQFAHQRFGETPAYSHGYTQSHRTAEQLPND